MKPPKKKKKSLVGYAEKRCFWLFDWSFGCPGFSISRAKEQPDDKKVRVTIEEL